MSNTEDRGAWLASLAVGDVVALSVSHRSYAVLGEEVEPYGNVPISKIGVTGVWVDAKSLPAPYCQMWRGDVKVAAVSPRVKNRVRVSGTVGRYWVISPVDQQEAGK